MPSIEPTSTAIKEIMADSAQSDGPIRMINLLRFAEVADYGESADDSAPSVSGAEAYALYAAVAFAEVLAVGGTQFYSAVVHQTVIGPPEEEWDQAIIIEYPSRAAFLAMVSEPRYQAVVHHRTAALVDSRLIMTTGF